MVAGDLMSRARAGDGDAFRGLTEPHHRELLVDRYRYPLRAAFNKQEGALEPDVDIRPEWREATAARAKRDRRRVEPGRDSLILADRAAEPTP